MTQDKQGPIPAITYCLLPTPLLAFLLNKGFLAGISAPHLFSLNGQSATACPLWRATMGG